MAELTPPKSDYEEQVLGYMKEAIEEGENNDRNEAQCAAHGFDESRRAMTDTTSRHYIVIRRIQRITLSQIDSTGLVLVLVTVSRAAIIGVRHPWVGRRIRIRIGEEAFFRPLKEGIYRRPLQTRLRDHQGGT